MRHRAKHEQTAFHFCRGWDELANSLETGEKQEKFELSGVGQEAGLSTFETLSLKETPLVRSLKRRFCWELTAKLGQKPVGAGAPWRKKAKKMNKKLVAKAEVSP